MRKLIKIQTRRSWTVILCTQKIANAVSAENPHSVIAEQEMEKATRGKILIESQASKNLPRHCNNYDENRSMEHNDEDELRKQEIQ